MGRYAANIRFREIEPTEIGEHYWELTANGELPLMRCSSCGQKRHYLTRVCSKCESIEYTWISANGIGTIYASTEIFYAPSDEFEVPYVLALVDLDEGIRMMANILDARYDDVPIGTKVRLDFQVLPDGKKLPQFRVDAR
jgi:hypothetical protein